MRFTFMSDCLLSLLIDGMEMEEFEREKKSILHFNSCIGLVISLGFNSVYFFVTCGVVVSTDTLLWTGGGFFQ